MIFNRVTPQMYPIPLHPQSKHLQEALAPPQRDWSSQFQIFIFRMLWIKLGDIASGADVTSQFAFTIVGLTGFTSAS